MQPAGAIQTREVTFYRQGQKPLMRRDRLITEEPLEIKLVTGPLNQTETRSFVVTLRTPGQDYELAAGLLFAEGVIRRGKDILKMTYCVGENKEIQMYNQLKVRLHPRIEVDWERFSRQRDSHGSCGLCGKTQIAQLHQSLHPDFVAASPQMAVEQLWDLSHRLKPFQKTFTKTGSVHAAALFDTQNGKILRVSEDVGRHNALDKLIGAEVLAEQLPHLSAGLWVSGRLSFELIQKALRASIPLVVAVGAPSSLAIELAETYGQTVVGFLKKETFNVYSAPERLVLGASSEISEQELET